MLLLIVRLLTILLIRARSFIFSTALSPADIGAALCALHH